VVDRGAGAEAARALRARVLRGAAGGARARLAELAERAVVIAEAGDAGVLRLVAAEQPAVACAVAVVLAAQRARVAAGLGRAPAPGGAAVPRREAGDASVLRGIAQLLHRARAVAVG